ncbi:hypothetical protein NOVOSPHI9U_260013 [Novosphingobium sp. 9U]|nr:hypothetical protein NOVOSPHI9U_260013 [Novosphingobium sp. 9U]
MVTTGQLLSNSFFQADVARERAEMGDEVNEYKVYSILQLSVGYAF